MNRVEKLQKLLDRWNVNALYISHPKDIFYLLGIELSKGALFISKAYASLIVDGRYFEACKAALQIDVRLDAPSVYDDLAQTMERIGFDENQESYAAYQKLVSLFPKAHLLPISHPVHELRMVKDEEELKKIKTACALGSEGFDFVVQSLHEGISEKELALELELFWKKKGADSLAFDSIIAFGKNSALPHHRAGNTRLEKNQIVLIDIGVKVDHYNSDMTRVVHFGDIDPKLQEIEAVVIEAQSQAVKACKAGVYTVALDQIARDVIIKAGFGEYFVHNLGHGVGLDIHEFPVLKRDPSSKGTLLQPGMVVTIEPGIYLPGLGGVRIEDTLFVQEEGALDLTKRAHKAIVKTVESCH